jgi:hypothetical protein
VRFADHRTGTLKQIPFVRRKLFRSADRPISARLRSRRMSSSVPILRFFGRDDYVILQLGFLVRPQQRALDAKMINRQSPNLTGKRGPSNHQNFMRDIRMLWGFT